MTARRGRGSGTRGRAWADDLRRLLAARPAEVSALSLTARSPLWSEDDLPFTLHGAGAIVRVDPRRGFSRGSLALSSDESDFILEAEEGGWLVPHALVADWMARNVRNDALADLLTSHAAYARLLKQDARGHTLLGRAPLVQWTPGVPTVATLHGLGPLPGSPAARGAYAAAACDLVDALDAAIGIAGLDVTLDLGARR